MTHIRHILDAPGLARQYSDGYIRIQKTDALATDRTLRIYNYTEKCVFDSAWTNETKASRGLIIDGYGNVLARPFPKFFNYGQSGAADIRLDDEVIVTDKMDGSLGIIFLTPDNEVRVATRGSFHSDQAEHATRLLNTKYAAWVRFFKEYFSTELASYTPLVEIIYPENRIVCDYGSQDDLVFLGSIDIRSGKYQSANMGYWDGPRTKVFTEYKTLADVLAAEPREGAEGFVVYSPRLNDWVKVKQDDYIELHRIVTGLSARRVYQALNSGQSAEEICAPLPDEFHSFVRDVERSILNKVRELFNQTLADFEIVLYTMREVKGLDVCVPEWRKEFAMLAKKTEYPSLMFMMLDNKPVMETVWKMFEPDADWVPGNHDQYM